MGKENISATVDPEVARYLKRDSVNTSGLVNRLLLNYLNGNSGELQMLKLREQQLEAELESARETVNTTEKQLDSVQERIKRLEADRRTSIEEAVEALKGIDGDIDKDNPAVEHQAKQAEIPKEQLWDEYLNTLS